MKKYEIPNQYVSEDTLKPLDNERFIKVNLKHEIWEEPEIKDEIIIEFYEEALSKAHSYTADLLASALADSYDIIDIVGEWEYPDTDSSFHKHTRFFANVEPKPIYHLVDCDFHQILTENTDLKLIDVRTSHATENAFEIYTRPSRDSLSRIYHGEKQYFVQGNLPSMLKEFAAKYNRHNLIVEGWVLEKLLKKHSGMKLLSKVNLNLCRDDYDNLVTEANIFHPTTLYYITQAIQTIRKIWFGTGTHFCIEPFHQYIGASEAEVHFCLEGDLQNLLETLGLPFDYCD